MQSITTKKLLIPRLQAALLAYHQHSLETCVTQTHHQLLSHKVKFPLLEFCAARFHEEIAASDHISFCDEIAALQTEGGNVILGIMLQKRLHSHFEASFRQAARYIAAGEFWYVSDIIGARVFGFGLLRDAEKSILLLQDFAQSESIWVVRAVGAGAHEAIKKGLKKEAVVGVFQLLLSLGNVTDKEIRAGVGWAAKTTAKFHPDVIEKFQHEIEDKKAIGNWFRRKVTIGLDRYEYGQRDRS
jgi:hypothetical protein